MRVVFLPEVFEYLESLIPILYNNGYFHFEDSAVDYVEGLIDDIQTTLPARVYKFAPPYFDNYGKNMKYVGFPKNKRTTWYAFFTTHWENGIEIYLVRYIANNHVIAQHL
jgi:hypothetical protein